MNNQTVVDIKKIMEYLPHRYPMLLVDRIVEAQGDEKAVGLKNVTINEAIFEGHFPGAPVFPGVLIIEAMAQTAGVVVLHAMESDYTNKLVYFLAVDNVKFRKPVVPGDAMYIHVEKLQTRGSVWKYKGQAVVDGQVCAEAVVTAMLVDKEDA